MRPRSERSHDRVPLPRSSIGGRALARIEVYASDAAPPREARFAGLAPNFAISVDKLILAAFEKRRLRIGLFEGRRSPERQEWLWQQGRSRPGQKVTNVRNVLFGWHGFGLAADFAFKTASGRWYWPSSVADWKAVAELAADFGLASGAYWRMRDYPHLQPANLKVSPSDLARQLYASGGVEAVWKATVHERAYLLDL